MKSNIGHLKAGAGAAGLTVSNQGTINYDADGNLTNESSTQTDDPGVAGAANPTAFLVVSPATVSGTKTVAGTFVAGGNVTYTIGLFNAGPNAQFDNPGNEFVDVLPPQLQLVGVSATSGTAVATVGTNTVTWNGAIPANSSVTVTITATINPTGGGQIILNQGTTNIDAAGNGTTSARALARLYGSLACGGTIDGIHGLSRDLLKEATAVSSEGRDQVFGFHSCIGLGFALNRPAVFPEVNEPKSDYYRHCSGAHYSPTAPFFSSAGAHFLTSKILIALEPPLECRHADCDAFARQVHHESFIGVLVPSLFVDCHYRLYQRPIWWE